MREKGKSEEEIAAAFFVSVNVVHQRLRLAAVSPKLLNVYAEDGMTLDQLDTKRLTGLFSIVITPPRTAERVAKNPLGIYVHTFNWSQDVNPGELK